jgi:hypothetical protein
LTSFALTMDVYSLDRTTVKPLDAPAFDEANRSARRGAA